MSIADLGKFKPASFDTVIMMGNNFGLLGGRRQSRLRLRKLYRITSAGACIIAEATDPFTIKDPLHLRYQRSNRQRGRMSGQLRIRIRHKNMAIVGPWFDYLLVSQREMILLRKILAGVLPASSPIAAPATLR